MAKVARFQLPDGRVARFEVPDDYTPEQAQAEMQKHFQPQQAQQAAPQAQDFPSKTVQYNTPFGGTKTSTELAIPPEQQWGPFGAAIGRGLTDLGEGFYQSYLDNFADPATAEAYRNQVMNERQWYEQQQLAKSTVGKLGRFVGKAAPFAAIPVSSASLPVRMALGAATGFGMGATDFRPEATPEQRNQERLSQGEIGAAIGGAIPGVISGVKALARPVITPIANALKKAVNSPSFAQNEQLLAKAGMGGTLGAKAGNESLLNLEATVRGSTGEEAKQIVNRESKQILDSFKQFKSTVKDRPLYKTGNLVFKTADRAVRRLQTARVAEFGNAMDQIDQLGGNKFIRVDNLENFLSGEGTRGLGGTALKDQVANELADLQKLRGPEGFISARDLQEKLMAPLTKQASGAGNIWRNMQPNAAKQLASDALGALRKDIDQAITTGEGSQAATILKAARDRYAQNSKPIEEIKNSVLGTILKEAGVDVKGIGQMNMEKVGKTLNTMSPEQVKKTMGLLNRYNPTVAKDLINTRIDTAIASATKTPAGAPIDLIHLDVNKLAKELGSEDSIKALMGKDAQSFLNTIKAAKLAAPVRVGKGANTVDIATKSAGVIASQNPTFAAMRAVSFAAPSVLRKALLEPEGQRAIITLAREMAKPKSNQAAVAAAIATLQQYTGNQ